MTRLLFTILAILVNGCTDYAQELPLTPCNFLETINPDYSKASELQQALNELVTKGVPGTAVAIYSNEGWWAASAGLSKIESNTVMDKCNLQYLQSIAKTYMAVAILKLYEQGKIDLQAPIEQYLPKKYHPYLPNVSTVTVYMLFESYLRVTGV